jgi:hypothetical protein
MSIAADDLLLNTKESLLGCSPSRYSLDLYLLKKKDKIEEDNI